MEWFIDNTGNFKITETAVLQLGKETIYLDMCSVARRLYTPRLLHLQMSSSLGNTIPYVCVLLHH